MVPGKHTFMQSNLAHTFSPERCFSEINSSSRRWAHRRPRTT